MVVVFSVFVTLSFLDFKEMGVGLAVAVLIDATIVRGILLPASMKVLGDWNWYLPRWLEWLPHMASEEEAARPDEPGAVRNDRRRRRRASREGIPRRSGPAGPCSSSSWYRCR